MAVWWYVLYALIAIITLGIFLPDGLDGGLDNVPLLIVLLSILFVLIIIELIRYIRIFSIAKKHLKKSCFEIQKCNIFSSLFRKKNINIIAKRDGLIVNICILKISKKHLTYHFDDVNTVELYKFTRLAIKPSVRQANIVSRHVERKKVGTKYFNWKNVDKQNEISIILFNKLPNVISDSKHREGLASGDKICDEIYIYELGEFEKFRP